MEVKLPVGAKDLRIKHYASMAHVPEKGFTAGDNSVVFLAEFLGVRYGQVLDFATKDVRRMTELAVKALDGMELTAKLPQEITLNGEKFYRIDPDKIGIGWQIDWREAMKSGWITKDPVGLACLMYVQKGYNYSDVDENGNIVYPIASRRELFAEHFPLDLFIRAANFFLVRSLNSTKRSTVREIALNKSRGKISLVLRAINPFNGRRRSRQ